MVDVVTFLEVFFGLIIGTVIVGLFAYFSSSMIQVKLWYQRIFRGMDNMGTVDIWAARRVFTFIVSFNDVKWPLFKTKEDPNGKTFINPSNSKDPEDAGSISQRWGAPYTVFDYRDGAHPLRVASGEFQRGTDPSALTNMVLNVASLEQQKAAKERMNNANKVTQAQNPQIIWLVGLSCLFGIIAAYYGYVNSGSIAACLKPVVSSASNVAGGLISP